jgi:hypothetical protein
MLVRKSSTHPCTIARLATTRLPILSTRDYNAKNASSLCGQSYVHKSHRNSKESLSLRPQERIWKLPYSCIAESPLQIRKLSDNASSFDNMQITGVPNDVAEMIHKHASRPQTSASLQTLMKTGRGEYLHKTYGDHDHNLSDNAKVATDKILRQVAGFLRHELPIRLSRRILDLDRVPHMKEMNSVKQVRDLYVTSFLELLSVDKQIKNMKQEEEFAAILESIYERHASVLVQMARGAFELRAAIRNGTVNHGSITSDGKNVVEFDALEDTHAFLDRFYLSRIG